MCIGCGYGLENEVKRACMANFVAGQLCSWTADIINDTKTQDPNDNNAPMPTRFYFRQQITPPSHPHFGDFEHDSSSSSMSSSGICSLFCTADTADLHSQQFESLNSFSTEEHAEGRTQSAAPNFVARISLTTLLDLTF